MLNFLSCKRLSWPEIDFDKFPKISPLISNIDSSFVYLKFLNANEISSLKFTIELGDEFLVSILN